MITLLLTILFWLAALGIGYTYLGYPALMFILSRVRAAPVNKAPLSARCEVVIAAYNEARTLPRKLRSVLDGVNGKMVDSVWIGSDGSNDDTVAVIEALNDPRIRLVAFSERRGKPSVLNDLLARCQTGYVVFTDARQELAADALPALLANFNDPAVGVVSGELVFRQEGSGSNVAEGMDFYWRYEKFIRRAESQFRSVPGATGALYAMRRDLFRALPDDVLLDDVAAPMQAVVQGYRCLLEEAAVVYDSPSRSAHEEGVRKRRTIAGNAQLLGLFPDFGLPWRNPIWFEFISHKILRLFSPFLLALALVTSMLLITQWFFAALFFAQAGFYGMAALGLRDQGAGATRSRWLTAPAMFVRLNLITLAAWGDIFSGRYAVHWTRAYQGTDQ